MEIVSQEQTFPLISLLLASLSTWQEDPVPSAPSQIYQMFLEGQRRSLQLYLEGKWPAVGRRSKHKLQRRQNKTQPWGEAGAALPCVWPL